MHCDVAYREERLLAVLAEPDVKKICKMKVLRVERSAAFPKIAPRECFIVVFKSPKLCRLFHRCVV
jgi:hypothetical protein